jgi:hypothetical protein
MIPPHGIIAVHGLLSGRRCRPQDVPGDQVHRGYAMSRPVAYSQRKKHRRANSWGLKKSPACS